MKPAMLTYSFIFRLERLLDYVLDSEPDCACEVSGCNDPCVHCVAQYLYKVLRETGDQPE